MTQGLTEAGNDSQYQCVLPVDDGAEAFVEVLNANGVEYIFIAPGTDTIAVQEAVARMRAKGRPTPRMVLCLHESVAVSAAHGHFMISGRPQVCMVHVDVGTQNVGGAIQNAYKAQIGVLLCAGITPYTTDGELRAGRSGGHQWLQEPMTQASSVRENVKWLYELRTAKNINQIVQRGLQVAASEPCGPTYLMLPRELMMEPFETVAILPPARYGACATPIGDPDILTEAAEALVRAQHPLILTNRLGRKPAAVASLVALAELLAIPVVETRYRYNFPLNHPMHLGLAPQRYFKDADVILELDHPTPYAPILGRPRSDAKIIRLSIDPVERTFPLWSFPADLAVSADTSKALPVITASARRLMRDADRDRIDERRRKVTAEHDAMLTQWDNAATSNAQRVPIHSAWLTKCVNDVVGQNAIYVSEVTTNSPAAYQQIRPDQPGTFFFDSAASLGWAMGAALGAKLADLSRDVVCLLGDGSFHFSSPLACLWAAEAYKIPFLTVLYNNASLRAVQDAIIGQYPEGHGRHADSGVGHQIVPSPKYELAAQACHAYAETVTDPAQIKPALERALGEVRGGRAALLDVIIGQY